jgi:hypothetical protein
MIKSSTVRREWHITRSGKDEFDGILLGNPKVKRRLGRPRQRWEDNIKMDLREIAWRGMD